MSICPKDYPRSYNLRNIFSEHSSHPTLPSMPDHRNYKDTLDRD